MTIIDFFLLALASGAVVRAWLNPDGFFEDFRDWLSVMWSTDDDDEVVVGSPADVPRSWAQYSREKIIIGLACAVCMSYHASFWLLVLYGISLVVVSPWSWLLQVPMYVFAITRVSLFIRSCELALTRPPNGADPLFTSKHNA